MQWRFAVILFWLTGCWQASVDSTRTRDASVTVRDAGPLIDAGILVVPDAGPPFDAGIIVTRPECPANLPGTGDVAGASITREGFGCFGGCGPSCKAECLTQTVTLALSAGSGCTSCTYDVTVCKSHELCRWHDDCYRQCDLRWAVDHAEEPASPPSNPCYLNCDNPVVKASTLCGADWSQLLASSPSVKDTCWDGSIVAFTTLAGSRFLETPEQCVITDERTRPWAPNTGAWSGSATTPTTLPHGYSCTNNSDCPDRNQYCNPDEGDYPGVNGWGRCLDTMPSPMLNVTPMSALGTRLVGPGAAIGAACSFGYDCASGRCQALHCISP